MSVAEPAPMPTIDSELTCPFCGARHAEKMPTDACIAFFWCPACGETLRPKQGDCCVFCSYGSVPCPPIQMVRTGQKSCGRCRD